MKLFLSMMLTMGLLLAVSPQPVRCQACAGGIQAAKYHARQKGLMMADMPCCAASRAMATCSNTLMFTGGCASPFSSAPGKPCLPHHCRLIGARAANLATVPVGVTDPGGAGRFSAVHPPVDRLSALFFRSFSTGRPSDGGMAAATVKSQARQPILII